MSNEWMADRPAHELLSALGKRSLRPGGKQLTLELLSELAITDTDDVVEFAPGTGYTAQQTLDRNPQSYTAVELDRDAAAALRQQFGDGCEILVGNAGNTDLDVDSADVVYGEAMLTLQPDEGKTEILNEAARLLRPGGRYGIHELGLVPDDIPAETKTVIYDDLAEVTRVNSRPLTESEWIDRLEAAGFAVTWIDSAPMALFSPRRVIADEGLLRTLKFGYNVLTTPAARRRLSAMRSVLAKYDEQLNAVAVVAETQ